MGKSREVAELGSKIAVYGADQNVGIGEPTPTATLQVADYKTAEAGNTLKLRSYAPSLVWEDITTSTTDFEIVANGNQLKFKSGDASVEGTLADTAMTMYSNGSLYLNGTSQDTQNYTYIVSASATNRPRLRQKDGTDFPKGQMCILAAFIDGTGTADTDWFGIVGYNGSGTTEIRPISAVAPGSSNRVAVGLDGSGYPIIYTGHPNDYTVRVRVIRL